MNEIVSASWFERVIIVFILINGVIFGMEASPSLVEHYGDIMHLGNHLILGIFIVEALLKMLDVVIIYLYEAKVERLAELQRPVAQKEILTDFRNTQKTLKRLEERLERAS